MLIGAEFEFLDIFIALIDGKLLQRRKELLSAKKKTMQKRLRKRHNTSFVSMRNVTGCAMLPDSTVYKITILKDCRFSVLVVSYINYFVYKLFRI